jgi:hypothetical protein
VRKFVLPFLLVAVTGIGFSGVNPVPAQAQDADKLAAVVQKGLEYCRRLDKAALDFICTEYVEEAVNRASRPSATAVTLNMTGETYIKPAPVDSFKTTYYLYDYQFVRKGKEVKERRDLMEKDGEKVPQANAATATKHFKFRDILFGASILLGEGAAVKYEYSLVGEGKIQGDAVVVVACAARPEYAGKTLTGRASVRVRDGAVLKIDWDPESFSGYDEVLSIAEWLGMAPKIQSSTEFGIEKNGVRFPSLDVTEEAYTAGSKSRFVRSTTTIKYKDYKFFTVETNIDIKRP